MILSKNKIIIMLNYSEIEQLLNKIKVKCIALKLKRIKTKAK